jgi:hypothetical protein
MKSACRQQAPEGIDLSKWNKEPQKEGGCATTFPEGKSYFQSRKFETCSFQLPSTIILTAMMPTAAGPSQIPVPNIPQPPPIPKKRRIRNAGITILEGNKHRSTQSRQYQLIQPIRRICQESSRD